MLKRFTLSYFIILFFFYSTNLFSIENKILVKIEQDIITSIDIENESKYLLLLNVDIYNDFHDSIHTVISNIVG